VTYSSSEKWYDLAPQDRKKEEMSGMESAFKVYIPHISTRIVLPTDGIAM
jgi:hypothetical protein